MEGTSATPTMSHAIINATEIEIGLAHAKFKWLNLT